MFLSCRNSAKQLRIFTAIIVVMNCVRVETYSTSVVRSGRSRVDRFSVPRCGANSCRRISGASGCASDDCCSCRCAYDKATFFFSDTTAECVSNNVLFNKCKFTFTERANEPTLVVNMTSSKGKAKFQQSPDVQCSSSGEIVVSGWQYLLNGRWVGGHGDVFRVETKPQIGGRWNPRQLVFLEWTSALDEKYAGLLVKFELKCPQGKTTLGCSLIKTEGNHTFPDPRLAVLDLITPTTTVAETTPHTRDTATKTSQPGSTAAAVEEERDSRTENRVEGESSKNTLVVAMAATGSALAVLGFIFVAVVLCRRRLKQRSMDSRPVEALSTAAEQTHEEFEYEEMPAVPGQFDNPTYGADSELVSKGRSRMDPLPPVPYEEQRPAAENSTYQSLVRRKQETTPGSQMSAYKNPVCPTFPANNVRAESLSRDADEDPRTAMDQAPNLNHLYDNENRASTHCDPAAVLQEASSERTDQDREVAPQEPFYVTLEQSVPEDCDVC